MPNQEQNKDQDVVEFHPHIWQNNYDKSRGNGFRAHVGIYRNNHRIQWIDAYTAAAFPGAPQALIECAQQAIEECDKVNESLDLPEPEDRYATPTTLQLDPDSYVGPLNVEDYPMQERRQRGQGRSQRRGFSKPARKSAADQKLANANNDLAKQLEKMQAERDQYQTQLKSLQTTTEETPTS